MGIYRKTLNSILKQFHARSVRSAFTLIEVLITVVILSTGIVVVLSALNSSLFRYGIAQDALQATVLMEEKMAETEKAAMEGGDVLTGLTRGTFRPPYSRFVWEQQVRIIPEFRDVVTADEGVSYSLYEVNLAISHNKNEYYSVTYVRARNEL